MLNFPSKNFGGDNVYNAKLAKYGGAKGDGSTDDRVALQVAIDAAYTAGGGIVYLPEGDYRVSGTGTAAAGCLQLKNNVTLMGAGRDKTIIKLKDQWSHAASAHKITGIVRTPSGEITRNAGLVGITLDGNRHKQTLAITSITFVTTTATVTTAAAHGLASSDEVTIDGADDPLYNKVATITVTGASTFTYTLSAEPALDAVAALTYISRDKRGKQAVTTITRSGTTATVTTGAAHNKADGDIVIILGASDQLYNGAQTITVTGASTFTYTLASVPSANAAAGLTYAGCHDAFFCGVTPASAKKDVDIFILDCQAKHFSHYGLDPHEQTLRLRANRNVIWDCILDGLVCDYLVESDVSDNHLYLNGRHGMNVVTTTTGLTCANQKTESNGWHNGADHGNGISIQNGSKVLNFSNPHSRYDYGYGFRVTDGLQVNVTGGNIEYCGYDGILLEGLRGGTITGVNIYNPSQETDATYDGVVVKDASTVDSANIAISNVHVTSDATNKHRRALREDINDALNCNYSNFYSVGHQSDQPYDLDGNGSTALNMNGSITTTTNSVKTVLQLECIPSGVAMVNFRGVGWNVTDSLGSWFNILHAVSNVAATVALLGSAQTASSFGSTDIAAIAADDTDDTADCNITGIAGKTINWKYRFDIQKVL